MRRKISLLILSVAIIVAMVVTVPVFSLTEATNPATITAAPLTPTTQVAYDCDTARKVCFDIHYGIRLLCEYSCKYERDPNLWSYEMCMSVCGAQFASGYERCVYDSTAGECFPFKHMGTKPGDN
jgi:hypothetical protein